MIVDWTLDFNIFLLDLIEPHSHDVDVEALLRVLVLINVPLACNRSTADFMIFASSEKNMKELGKTAVVILNAQLRD